MVDGLGLQTLQRIVGESGDPHVQYFAGQATSVAGTIEGKSFLLVFDKIDSALWLDPASSITYVVRGLDKAFYNKRSVFGATYAGYNGATKTIVIWDAMRTEIDIYRGVDIMHAQL